MPVEIFFWTIIVFIFYTYIGYPLLLVICARLFTNKVLQKKITPFVSVIIAAYNEEKSLPNRLENLFKQDYPADKYEVIVVSDGSTDCTDKLVSTYANRNVRLISLDQKSGKAVALNYGVAGAKGEIIVFADARQTFSSDVFKHLVANFSDPSIGCVSGELVFLDDTTSGIRAEMGAYWKYEKLVRRLESASGSVVGATGAIFTIRRALYRELPPGTILDDVMTPLNVVMQGYRVVFDGEAIAYDVVSKDLSQEWRRKIRTLAGNWQLLSQAPKIMNPFSNPVWWRFVSHKLFRLIVPFLLPLLLAVSWSADGVFYKLCALMQVLFYLLAGVGFILPATCKNRLINLAYFFTALNFAVMVGFWYWISGQCAATWQPAYFGNPRTGDQ